MKITDMSELNKAFSYFREFKGKTKPVSHINFSVYWDLDLIIEATVNWAGDEEDMEFYLAMAFGSVRGTEIRTKGSGRLGEYFLWFNNDSMVTYQFDPEDLKSFPAFLGKVKFAIENYVAFYL